MARQRLGVVEVKRTEYSILHTSRNTAQRLPMHMDVTSATRKLTRNARAGRRDRPCRGRPARWDFGENYSDSAAKVPMNALFLSGLVQVMFKPSPAKLLSTVWAGMAWSSLASGW